MSWIKKGVLWNIPPEFKWAKTHATCPTPILTQDGKARVFFQGRDEKNVGRIGYIDINPENPSEILNVSETPVLDVGQPGTFDDSGVFQCSVVEPECGKLFMYYAGFELLQSTRYRLLSGLAISEDGGKTFTRLRSTPILERSERELIFRCGPSVIFENNIFKMWYVAGSDWETIGDKLVPVYSMKYLESSNGVDWANEGELIMSPSKDEHGFGRPLVYSHGDRGYQMIYSIRNRNKGYRMAFAWSVDGKTWAREDKDLEIDVSTSGPDSETIEFGAFLSEAHSNILLYNGNDFGATGILWATRI